MAAGLDGRRDGLAQVLEQRVRLALEQFPVAPARELPQLLLAVRDAERRDPEALERGDPILDLLLRRFRDLALLAQPLGLFLEDPCQPR